MSLIDPYFLRVAPCVFLAPTYKEDVEVQLAKATSLVNPHKMGSENYIKFERDRANGIEAYRREFNDPLKALRMQFALEMEKLFNKKGTRSIIFGCMHVRSSSDFHQTTTDIIDLLPKQIMAGEDHRHQLSVTVDIRYRPDECIELPLEKRTLIITIFKFEKIPSDGPDFARRDCENKSHLEDFLYVKNVNKIYAERLPFLEKGPLAYNLFFFETIHKLLATGGIFAFDYIPFFDVLDCKGDSIKLVSLPVDEVRVSQKEIEDFMVNPIYLPYFSRLKEYKENPPVPCSTHESCPIKPCPSLLSQIAKTALTAKKNKELMAQKLTEFRTSVSQKAKTALSKEELFFKIGNQKLTRAELNEKKDLPLNAFEYGAITINLLAGRTFDEMCSLQFQIECYRVLNVAPSKEVHLHPETKAELDSAITLFTEIFVFPQLKLLNFEKAAPFDPNGKNPENNRPFERVIYVKKV